MNNNFVWILYFTITFCWVVQSEYASCRWIFGIASLLMIVGSLAHWKQDGFSFFDNPTNQNKP